MSLKNKLIPGKLYKFKLSEFAGTYFAAFAGFDKEGFYGVVTIDIYSPFMFVKKIKAEKGLIHKFLYKNVYFYEPSNTLDMMIEFK